MSNKMHVIFKFLELPRIVSWEETSINAPTRKRADSIIINAPMKGAQLVISGVSSPVMQGFYQNGRKISAVDYYEVFNAKFTDEPYEMPPARQDQVTLIYNVGKEPVKNFEYSSKLLQGLINKFSANGLVVVETTLTPSTFNMQYGLDFKNKLSIPIKPEAVWA